MRMHYWAFGLTVLLFTGAVLVAEADTQQFHCKGGGTFTDGVETNIDTNGDGVSATVDQGAEVCNTGNAIFQEEAEWIQQTAVSADCPAGTTLELRITPTNGGQHRAVFTDTGTGDQAFSQMTSAIQCFNESTLKFTGHGQGIIVGGTGKNTGASGTFTSHFTGSYRQVGFKNGVFGGFGQFTFTLNGTLILLDDPIIGH